MTAEIHRTSSLYPIRKPHAGKTSSRNIPKLLELPCDIGGGKVASGLLFH